jgi:purine-nucleoside phosphorylase
VSELLTQINEAVDAIRQKCDMKPDVGIICGTGMGDLADQVEGAVKIPYREIPHFPLSTVESHKGFLVLGKLEGKNVAVMQGRFHRYEGYTLKQVTFPVRVMKVLGADNLIIMNAVGSMNIHIPGGSIVFISDHINMMGDNPLIGPNEDSLGPRFPDMSQPYNRDMIALAEEVARENKIKTHRGVAIAVTGPCLETAAEYRFFRRVGADIVTMSTIPEAIVGTHMGMKILGISTVTDECYPDALGPADIDEIIRIANELEPQRQAIVRGVLKKL